MFPRAVIRFAEREPAVGGFFEPVGHAIRRENYDDALRREELANALDRGREVAVGRHEKCGVIGILVGVCEEFDGDVHVGHLFLVGLPDGAALTAVGVFLEIMAEKAARIGERLERFEVVALAAVFAGIRWGG